MRTRIVLLGAIILLAVVLSALLISKSQKKISAVDDSIKNTMTQEFKITSPAFEDNGQIPSEYTCDGENISPPLEIVNMPPGTKSMVLVMDDPDAPIGIWDHWVKWNIPPSTKIIPEGTEPEGVSGRGTSGNLKYYGPCPPGGTHRYIFKLYALDTELKLTPGVPKAELEAAMEGHIINMTKIIGLYSRKNF